MNHKFYIMIVKMLYYCLKFLFQQ